MRPKREWACSKLRVGPLAPDLPMMSPIEFVSVQPDLWVDPNGERFCDETIGLYDTSVGNASARHKEGYTWSIFDDSIIERILTQGIERNISIDNPPGTKPTGFWKELEAAFARGGREVFAADSIEELAVKLGIGPTALKATVDEYNGFCAKGHDALFAKSPKYLRPLKGPRFYASKMRTIFLGTLGGIKINERTEVIDKKGKVLSGLYAVGFDAGGMWGDSYSIKDSSGLSAGFAIYSGRIAGKNAVRYLGK